MKLNFHFSDYFLNFPFSLFMIIKLLLRFTFEDIQFRCNFVFMFQRRFVLFKFKEFNNLDNKESFSMELFRYVGVRPIYNVMQWSKACK